MRSIWVPDGREDGQFSSSIPARSRQRSHSAICSEASGGKPEDGEDDVMIQSISRHVMGAVPRRFYLILRSGGHSSHAALLTSLGPLTK